MRARAVSRRRRRQPLFRLFSRNNSRERWQRRRRGKLTHTQTNGIGVGVARTRKTEARRARFRTNDNHCFTCHGLNAARKAECRRDRRSRGAAVVRPPPPPPTVIGRSRLKARATCELQPSPLCAPQMEEDPHCGPYQSGGKGAATGNCNGPPGPKWGPQSEASPCGTKPAPLAPAPLAYRALQAAELRPKLSAAEGHSRALPASKWQPSLMLTWPPDCHRLEQVIAQPICDNSLCRTNDDLYWRASETGRPMSGGNQELAREARPGWPACTPPRGAPASLGADYIIYMARRHLQRCYVFAADTF